MPAYPGPGTEILGALKLYPTYYTVGGPDHAVAIASATPFSMAFSTTGGYTLYYLLPKLGTGDSWLNGYMTGWVSADTTDSDLHVAAAMQYVTGGGTQATAGSQETGINVTAGPPLAAEIDHFLFPDLVGYNAQGVAVPILIDFNLANVSGRSFSALQGMNSYNTSGLRGQIIPTSTTDHADFVFQVRQADVGGSHSDVIYNPVITLFSLLQYAWIPPSAGGVSIAPEMLALGMFGRRRNA